MTWTILWPVGLTLLMLVGAYLDTKYRRLPNWLAGVLLVYGIAHGVATDSLGDLPWYIAHTIAALVVGMGLFAIGMVGGGDAKFYAGTATYFILWDALSLLLAVSLAGIVLVLVWFASRRIRRTTVSSSNPDMAKFPYGIAIAAGAICAAFLL